MVDRYRRRIAAMVIQLAKDDPKFVKEMIQEVAPRSRTVFRVS